MSKYLPVWHQIAIFLFSLYMKRGVLGSWQTKETGVLEITRTIGGRSVAFTNLCAYIASDQKYFVFATHSSMQNLFICTCLRENQILGHAIGRLLFFAAFFISGWAVLWTWITQELGFPYCLASTTREAVVVYGGDLYQREQ